MSSSTLRSVLRPVGRSAAVPSVRGATTGTGTGTGKASGAAVGDELAGADAEQVRLMEERVIVVDEQDTAVGSMSKRDAHLIRNGLPLHRAFSLFLFGACGRLVLQRRADTKVTFPGRWTNTVCSHPLDVPGENDVSDSVTATKRAVLRKLTHELGAPTGSAGLRTDDLHYMTRILYRAECDDGIWGEHELDYVFVAQKDVPLEPQPNEVSHVRLVDESQLKEMFEHDKQGTGDVLLTPWFKIIMDAFGWRYWKQLRESGLQSMGELRDADNVHIMR